MPSATPIPASTRSSTRRPRARVYPRRSPGRPRRSAIIPRACLAGPPAAPRYPLETFVWTRALIWGGTLLAYLVFEAQYAQPLHTGGGAEDVVQHDVGWAIDVWGRWDSGWFLGIAEARLRRPGPSRPPSSRSTRCSCAASGGSSSATTCWRGCSSRLAASAVGVRPPLAARPRAHRRARRANRTVLYLALFPTTLFLFAVYSESLYLALSVGAFLLALRGALDVGRDRDRPRGARTRLRASMLLPALACSPGERRTGGGALLRLALVAADHGALAALPRPEVRPALRVPDGAALGLGPAPVGGRPARRRLGGARRRLARRPPARRRLGTTTSRTPTTARCTGRGSTWSSSPTRVAARRARRLRLARARRRLRDLRAREPRAARSPTRSRAAALSMPRFALGMFPVFIALGLLGARPRWTTRRSR